jgi:hypothetical protein
MPTKTTTYLQLCAESTQLWRCAWTYVRTVRHSLTYHDAEDHVVFNSWSLSPVKITTLSKMWGCDISYAKNPSCLGCYVALLGECSDVLTEHRFSIFKQSLSPSPTQASKQTSKQTNKQTNKLTSKQTHTHCMHMLVIVTSAKHFNWHFNCY